MENVVLVEGLRLIRLGLCVIPLKPKQKKPAVRSWKRYQGARPDESDPYHWWANHPERGLAIVLGEVSLCIGARDFDTREAYQRWAAENRELAAILPTVETSRGRHVYFRVDFEAIRRRGKDTVFTFDDGELRLSGSYVAAPPSIHPSGSQYRWLIPMVELPPVVDVFSCGFFPCYREDGEHQENREDRANRDTEITKKQKTCTSKCVVTTKTQLKSGDFTPEELQAIQSAIRTTLPNQKGQRHVLVFALCRALKAIPSIADADALQLVNIVRKWWEQAREFSPTPWEEHLADFLEGWDKVKYPAGSGPMAMILRRAKAQTPPPAALQFEQEQLRLLVALCCELQREVGDGKFYLSARTAGRLLEIDHVKANRWMRFLVRLGILELVEAGSRNPSDRRANRFRYLPPI